MYSAVGVMPQSNLTKFQRIYVQNPGVQIPVE